MKYAPMPTTQRQGPEPDESADTFAHNHIAAIVKIEPTGLADKFHERDKHKTVPTGEAVDTARPNPPAEQRRGNDSGECQCQGVCFLAVTRKQTVRAESHAQNSGTVAVALKP